MPQAFPQYCSRCGLETTPTQKFCARCGLPIVSPIPIQRDFSPVAFPRTAQSARRRIGRVGVITLVVVALLILGVAGYFFLPLLGIGKASQAAITTSSIHTTVNYAGVDIAIQTVQQADNFIDDPHTQSDGMVRVQVQAVNKMQRAITLNYLDVAHLILPNGNEVQPLYPSNPVELAVGEKKSSDIDFPVTTSTKVNQLLFRLGAMNEARMDIALTGHADVSKYTSKSIDVNKKATYLSLNYLLTQATSAWSLDGQQAPTGMRYVVLGFKIDNPLTEPVIAGSPFDYMRIKAGATMVAPQQASAPISLAANAQEQAGSAVFLVPQDAATFALVLATKSGDGFEPGQIDISL